MKKKIYTAMILDDLLHTLKWFESVMKEFSFVRIDYRIDNMTEAFQILQNQRIDILFLDMEMPESMGWEFAKLLKDPPVIIIVSAHQEAYRANEIEAKGYLSKMPAREEVRITLENAIREVDFRDELMENKRSYIIVKNFATKLNQIINLDEFGYAEIEDKDITVFIRDGETVPVQSSLSKLHDDLPKYRFIRISAKHIISRDVIVAYNKNMVTIKLDTGKKIHLEIHYPPAYEVIDSWLTGM
ncbi:LytR/AlgR family response regulator transcription factor [Sphingobacterium sp. LRF_L2]|uniref:LytR/AlgR family response regulator transcription factor n=1 Tax=Sphingobacterium sp. LRF_L2 TaxID=3369421 RepID=UPI003F5F7985